MTFFIFFYQQHFCPLCYCTNDIRGRNHVQLCGDSCKVCNKNSCCHWPVNEIEPLAILEEGQIILPDIKCSKLKKPELQKILKQLGIDDVDNNTTRIMLIEEWYNQNHMILEDINIANIRKIDINLTVRGMTTDGTFIQKKKHLRSLMVQEIIYKKQIAIKDGGENSIPVGKCVLDLLHLQVIYLSYNLFLKSIMYPC